MHLMRACLLACLPMIFRVGSTEPELPTLDHWAPAEWIDEWYTIDATAAMLENPSLPTDSSTVQATQKDQQASWGDDPYCIHHIHGAVIPPSTPSPPLRSPHSHAPPSPELLKVSAHSPTNLGLAKNTHTLIGEELIPELIPADIQAIITHPPPNGSNRQCPFEQLFCPCVGAQQSSFGPQTHTLVGDEPIPANIQAIITHPLPNPSNGQYPFEQHFSPCVGVQQSSFGHHTHTLVGDEPIPPDIQAISTYPLPNGSNTQYPFEQLISPCVGAQQSSFGPQMMPESSHICPAILAPNFFPFSNNPHPPSSQTAPQPWHQDTTTLDNPYNLLAESTAAQEEPHTFIANSHDYPTGHSAAESMSLHPPLLHPPAQAGSEIQTAHSQNANPTGLLGHEPNPCNLQITTNQLTNGPNNQDSLEHLIYLSPYSSPQFMPHSSYTNIASGSSHIPYITENSEEPSFKTTNPQSKKRTHQRISKLKPSTKPLRKQPPRAKKTGATHSSGLSQTSQLIPMPSNTELDGCLATSFPFPEEINELTPHHRQLEFDMTLFDDVSSQDPLHNAWREIFQHEIDQLPGKLLIIQEDKFQVTYVKYLSRNAYIQPHLIAHQLADLLQRIINGKVLEFQGDMKLWYRRWHMITSLDFEKDHPIPRIPNSKMKNLVEVVFCLYLFYVEMICSIVPRQSTTNKALETELNSAKKLFNTLSTYPTKLLERRLMRVPYESLNRCAMPILWTYLGHWMRNERPGVFAMKGNSEDVVPGIKSFFNRAFAFSYSAIARKYNCKKQI